MHTKLTASMKRDIHKVKSQIGFTLMELMVVVVIIAILAAIAVPSYRRYVVKNAEDETKAQMQQIQIQLERWRATALSYKGFVPQNGVDSSDNIVYGYVIDANYNTKFGSGAKIIYVPRGSTATTHRYAIGLIDAGDISTVNSTKALNNTGVSAEAGRSWRMLAVPNPNGAASTGDKIMLTSRGLQCQTNSNITIISPNCGSNSELW